MAVDVQRQSIVNRQATNNQQPANKHYVEHYDKIPKNVTANEIRDDMRDFGIGILHMPNSIDSITVEDDVSWLHVDVRNNASGVNFFKP